MNMLQMSEAMRDGRSISLKSQTQLIIALSIPAILEQLVMTLMSYIDTAMVGSLGPGATAAIGVVASSIWLMNGLDQRHCRGLFRPDRPVPGEPDGTETAGTSCASSSWFGRFVRCGHGRSSHRHRAGPAGAFGL